MWSTVSLFCLQLPTTGFSVLYLRLWETQCVKAHLLKKATAFLQSKLLRNYRYTCHLEYWTLGLYFIFREVSLLGFHFNEKIGCYLPYCITSLVLPSPQLHFLLIFLFTCPLPTMYHLLRNIASFNLISPSATVYLLYIRC